MPRRPGTTTRSPIARRELQPFLREVEAFAEDVYAPVLFKGTRATAAERQAVLDGLARYTGVSADYWDKANLRLDEPRFLQELLRDKGQSSSGAWTPATSAATSVASPRP